jgi:hypothetical protein
LFGVIQTFAMKISSTKWMLALVGASLAATSLSQQGEVIRPYRQIQTGPAVVMSTSDFSPQIRFRTEYTARPLTPNASMGATADGPRNNLKAGSVTSKKVAKLGPFFPGISHTGWVPPDPNIAVGPAHVVQVVNSDVAFFNKTTGVKTFQQPGDGGGFFSGVGVQSDFTFDPKCYYDKLSGRFFVLFLEKDDSISKLLLAVSDDSDPNGTWFKYRIESKTTRNSEDYWLDYPGFGVNKDAVVICGNMFPFTTGTVHASIVVLPKAPLLSGATSVASYLLLDNVFSIQTARTADPLQSVMYGCYDTRGQTSTTLGLVAISNLTSTPTLVKTTVTIPARGYPSPIPTGGNRFLDMIDPRIFNCHFRGGRLVAAHTAKATDGRMHARWYEISVNTWPSSGSPALRQSGNILVGGTNTHMPAINTNAAGDISVIYTRNNGTTNPDTCISSRFANDPLGTIGAPQVIAASPGIYGSAGVNRWGDYFDVAIDPNDNLTFWGVGMISGPGGNWATHINKWVVSSGSSGVLIDATAEAVIQGEYVGGNLASLSASDNSRYTIQSVMIDKNGQPTQNVVGANGQAASLQVDFDLDLSGGAVTDLKAVVEANLSSSGASGQLFAYNWISGTFISVGSFSLSTSDKTATITIPKSALSNYVDGTGNVRLLIRAFSPIRNGRPGRVPPQFIFGLDRVGLAPTFAASS